ncbi:hypothetical protein DL96DRAFT_1707542 [Flagelloscypha sp. PMI_526]|nr:hypothetical protein DL96DRAFT_1707542 [Flagelloscypha sp. PMI_526]
MCCSGPKWKREAVPDHKFDFVDTREFTDNGFFMRLKYLWLYLLVLKSFLVYVADIFSAVTMMTTKGWSNEIFRRCETTVGCISVPFNLGKWVFLGSIIFGFLLSKKIIASRDISYAFTNVIANNYYSLRSYDHFCFFDHISSSTKTSDDFAFFVFFTFKTWKRLLLSDAPRQTINILTLYAVYFNSSLSTSALTITTVFTVTIFIGSMLLLVAACLCYIPLLMHIRGNLKEYCCHKVDKRIDTIIKRRNKQRLVEEAKKAQKEAAGDYSHLKNDKGEIVGKALPQPTLPSVSLDDDDDATSYRTGTPAPPNRSYNNTPFSDDASYYNYNEKSVNYVPPMPAYNPYSHHQTSDVQFQSSQASLGGVDWRQQYYDDDGDSQAHVAAQNQYQGYANDTSRPGTAPPQQQQQPYLNPADVYGGRSYSPAPSSGYHVAYDDSTAANTPDPYSGYNYSNGYGQQQQQYPGTGRTPSPGRI